MKKNMFSFLVHDIRFLCVPVNAKICISTCGMLLQCRYTQKDVSLPISSSPDFSILDLNALTSEICDIFFFLFYPSKKPIAQAGKWPIPKWTGWASDTAWVSIRLMLCAFQQRKGSSGFFRCPCHCTAPIQQGFKTHLVEVAPISWSHPSAQTFSP